MQFRKFVIGAFGIASASASSTLFWGGTIVAFDETTEALKVIRDGALLITDDRIAGIYETTKPKSLPKDTERIDVSGQIITPGFVDTHRHGWQTAFKTIASNTSLAEYMARYSQRAAAGSWGPRDVYLGQLVGLWEALSGGVTTLLDHAHSTWSYEASYESLNATIESGARVFWAYTFQDFPGYSVTDQVSQFREIAESDIFQNSPCELGMAYDGWSISEDEEEKKSIVGIARKYKVSALTTHCMGGPWGFTNSPSDLNRYGMLDAGIPIVFSHASFLNANDVALLRSTNHYYSITPESHMHCGHGHPHVHLFQDRASLGVDVHFTFSGDILTQARLWLQSTRLKMYDAVLDQWKIPASSPMTAAHAFYLATRAGGLALRRPDLGVITVGAKADIIVWNARDSLSMLGWVDPVAAVILHASVGDILDVMVDGKFVKRNGKILAPNFSSIKSEFVTSAKKIQKKWSSMPYPPSDGKWFGVADLGHPQDIGTLRYGPLFVNEEQATGAPGEKDEL